MTIKAIETEYNGYKFRSRLEARWAVFFDALGVKYEYEPEGYEGMDGIKYLPDFRLPEENGVLVEVKGGDEALEKDWDKITAAVDFNATPAGDGLLILGNIPNPDRVRFGSIPVFSYLSCRKGVVCGYAAFFDQSWRKNKLVIGEDEILRNLFPSFSNNDGNRVEEDYSSWGSDKPECVTTEPVYLSRDALRSYQFNELKEAYRKARQARFEHGETPVVYHDEW